MPTHTLYTATEARPRIKDILDAADEGRVVLVGRDSRLSAVVDAARLREHLARTVAPNAEAVLEDGAWVITMPGRPIAVEATLYEDAVTEVVYALQEYADDWNSRLRSAPNHAANWDLVQLIGLSTEEQLKRWVVGSIE